MVVTEKEKGTDSRDTYKVKPIGHGNTYYVGGEGEGDY